MRETESKQGTSNYLVQIMIAGVMTAILAIIAQKLIVGDSNPAITGGVVGGVVAATAILRRQRSE